MIQAKLFLDTCKQHRFGFYSGTPCSYLKPFINAVIDDKECHYYDATNEGDAVAMACGASLTGEKSVVIFQNSGLGNAVNALTSLAYSFRFPLLLIVTHRGEPGGAPDEPQHELMGKITPELLETLEIPWEHFPQEEEEIPQVLERATTYMEKSNLPYALIMQKDSVASQELQTQSLGVPIGQRSFSFKENLTLSYSERATRNEALQILHRYKQKQDLVIATTGKTGRELFSLEDAANHLYMVGSMGSASSFSLGAAIRLPHHRVICIDGDAAVLMRMGNLASVGAFHPKNYLHIVLDNESNDSTGGQSTPTAGISLALIAQACGYSTIYSLDQLDEFSNLLEKLVNQEGPIFVHFRIRKGSPKELGRPTIKPHEVKERLMRYIQDTTP